MLIRDGSASARRLLRKEIGGLPVYDPGADPDEVMREHGLRKVIKLSNNENPYGMSPAAIGAVQKCIKQGLGRYPDPTGKNLLDILAMRYGIKPDRIVLGNGSEEILQLLCQAFVSLGDRVVTQAPCFGLHEIFPLVMGAKLVKVPLGIDFKYNIEEWRKALAVPTKLVFISNPSNPVGTAFSRSELESIIQFCPEDCLLVIDEAYFEYAVHEDGYPDAFQLLKMQNRPWIVLRTFSKAYGLAGLRVGYGIASCSDLIEPLHCVRAPYNVNQLAQVAAVAALEDKEHLVRSIYLVGSERIRLTKMLRKEGYRVAPSLANFLFIDTMVDASFIMDKLLCKGVIVKAWREKGYGNFIRVSISIPEENEFFLQAFTSIKLSL